MAGTMRTRFFKLQTVETDAQTISALSIMVHSRRVFWSVRLLRALLPFRRRGFHPTSRHPGVGGAQDFCGDRLVAMGKVQGAPAERNAAQKQSENGSYTIDVRILINKKWRRWWKK